MICSRCRFACVCVCVCNAFRVFTKVYFCRFEILFQATQRGPIFAALLLRGFYLEVNGAVLQRFLLESSAGLTTYISPLVISSPF